MPAKKTTRKKAKPRKQTTERTLYYLTLKYANGSHVPTSYAFTDRRKALAKAKDFQKLHPNAKVVVHKMLNPYRRKV